MCPSIGRGIGVNRFRAGGASYPAVLDDGNTVAWFDSAENITKDGSNLVSAWGDKSGLSHHLLQAGADAAKPLWSANGVLFDGTSDFMKCAAFTLVQPELIYMVFKQVTWTSADYIWDGNANLSGTLIQRTATPNFALYAGGYAADNANLALNTFGIIRALYSGAASKIIINETAPTTGTVTAGTSMGGFTLGSRSDGSSYSNIEVKEIIIRKIADTAPNEALIYEYLKKKFGF